MSSKGRKKGTGNHSHSSGGQNQSSEMLRGKYDYIPRKYVINSEVYSKFRYPLPHWEGKTMPTVAEVTEKWFDVKCEDNVRIGPIGGQIMITGT